MKYRPSGLASSAALAVLPRMVLVGLFLSLAAGYRTPAGAAASGGELKAGAATRVVNPTKPATPSGHPNETFVPPAEIYSDICTQAVVIEDESGKRFVLISSDHCYMVPEVADRLKELIRKEYGIGPASVCVHVAHNHAAPALSPKEGKGFDPEYAELYFGQTMAAVGEAMAGLVPVKLRYCEDICTSVAINRRGQRGGRFVNIPNNKGIVDFKVRVIAMESASDGKPSIILAEYAAHPCVTIYRYLGGEYPGYCRKWVENKYPGATAMFLQGCAGNIRIQVLNEERDDWIEGTPEMAERFGHDLADAVGRAMLKEGSPVVGPIEAEYKVVAAPLNTKTGPGSIPFRMQALRLGAGSKTPFVLVALGTEPFIETGLELERRLRPANSICIGYSNALAAYLPTAKAIEEGGYEPGAWGGAYGLDGPYAPEAEALIVDEAEKLARPKP